MSSQLSRSISKYFLTNSIGKCPVFFLLLLQLLQKKNVPKEKKIKMPTSLLSQVIQIKSVARLSFWGQILYAGGSHCIQYDPKECRRGLNLASISQPKYMMRFCLSFHCIGKRYCTSLVYESAYYQSWGKKRWLNIDFYRMFRFK